MRRSFSFAAERGRRARGRLIAATVLLVLIFILDAILGGPVRGALRGAVAALWSATSSVRLSITDSGYFASHRALARDNELLREQLASAQEDAAAYQGLKQENDDLRGLLHLASTTRGITAPVVSSFSTSPYGTFMIGAGKMDGIASGDLVLTSDGFVIGTVTTPGDRTSLVTGTFASGSSIDALVGSAPAVVEGRGGGNATARLPRDASVSVSDPVIAPSLGSRQIGVVGHIDASESSAEQVVYIRLPMNLSALRYVYIATR